MAVQTRLDPVVDILKNNEEDSHDLPDSNDPDEEGSDELGDCDWIGQSGWTYSKLRSPPTQAEYLQTLDPDEVQRNDKRDLDETKQRPESAKESRLEFKQGGSHDSFNSSDPDEEGSDEGEDSDCRTQKDRSFDSPYWSKQMNLPFQAECSRVIDD